MYSLSIAMYKKNRYINFFLKKIVCYRILLHFVSNKIATFAVMKLMYGFVLFASVPIFLYEISFGFFGNSVVVVGYSWYILAGSAYNPVSFAFCSIVCT